MFTNPDQNIDRFELLPGMRIADFGSGTGTYSILAAKIVGETGRVYAIDVQKELLSNVKSEALKNNLSNIEIIWGDLEEPGGSRLADASIDTVIASNILFQAEDKNSLAREIFRVLKPGKGKVFVMDWTDSFGGLGPNPEAVVTPEACKKIFLEEGFVFDKELLNVGAHHYGIAFRKA